MAAEPKPNAATETNVKSVLRSSVKIALTRITIETSNAPLKKGSTSLRDGASQVV
jgi:hypothetical protein